MTENPLLPDAQLRALLALTRRTTVLDAVAARQRAAGGVRKGSRASAPLPAREALLAATVLQLEADDLLFPEPGDTLLGHLSTPKNNISIAVAPFALPELGRATPRLLLVAAMAATLRHAASDRLLLVYTRAGAAEPAWDDALTWAQEQRLPLVLVCADPSGSTTFRSGVRDTSGAFTWTAVRHRTNRLQLPVLTVDGEDAVAVYRSMQESVLRARAGAGPALLWAALPSSRELRAGRAPGATPVRRLEQYLRARRIPLKATQG